MRRLDHVHANLPGVEEVVPPVVAAVFRRLVPNYMVREVFATRSEEIRASAEWSLAGRCWADVGALSLEDRNYNERPRRS